jgi:hypothetical protein
MSPVITPLIKKTIALFAMLVGVLTVAYGQTFYVNTSNQELKRVTITGNGLVTQDVTGCGNGYFSIAIYQNTLYYNLTYSTLTKATLTDGNTPSVSDCVSCQ